MSVEDSPSSTNDTTEVTESVKETKEEEEEEENTTTVEKDTTSNNETEIENESGINDDIEESIEAPPPPPPPKMPEDSVWEACWDENSKNYYFWNTETDEVTWDNPFEGEVTAEGEEEKKQSGNGDHKDNQDDSEDYEIEVEGYEEALAEQQKRQQEEEEEEEEKTKQKENTNTKVNTTTTATTVDPSTQSAYAYTNPADPNYYYGYGAAGGYDYSQYSSSYYGQYNYGGAYPTDYSAPPDKDTLSNFDSLLNKIDDAKEKLDDLVAGTDKDKKKDDNKTEEEKEKEKSKKDEEGKETTSATPMNSYADYWNYPPPQYTYPTPDTSATASTGQFQEYSVSGYFNKRTGRFQQTTNEMMANPQDYFTPESKGERQMQYYFNPEAYQQQYNAVHHAGNDGEDTGGKVGKRKLNRKEVEYFKKMKKQKRDDKLKRKYMD